MKDNTIIEGAIFLAINLAAPAIYAQFFKLIPYDLIIYVSLALFTIFQISNYLRSRKKREWRIGYFSIIGLNIFTLIMIGNLSFLVSIPDFWGLFTSLT